VVGETEVGGTSVLYISDIPLGFLSFRPDLEDTPLPDLTWAALSKVPPLVMGMTGLMAGLWWFTGRRNKVAEESARIAMADHLANEADAPSTDDGEDGGTQS